MPDTSKLEKLNRELEKAKRNCEKAINDEKALQHQLAADLPEGKDGTGSVLVAVCWKVFCRQNA